MSGIVSPQNGRNGGMTVAFVAPEVFRFDRVESAFDFDVFSGLTLRDNVEYPFEETAWIDTNDPKPLQLIKSGLIHPKVMMPSNNLVVIEEVARRLEQIPNVKLLPVELLRVTAVRMGDQRQRWPEVRQDPRAFFRGLRDDARLRERMPRYYELLAARLHTIWDRYDAPEIDYDFSVPKVRIKICARMFADFPVINRSGVLLAPQIADIILPELDMRFFNVGKLWVPE